MLGLPRGGVPVAYEVAMALEAPLDVFIVRKLGVPGFEELLTRRDTRHRSTIFDRGELAWEGEWQ